LAGPNHILPTGGTARFSSALGVWDFQKRIQYLEYDRAALVQDGPAVTALARQEGLEGHARAIEIRGK
ncbi:histidinol dehydrogenase, partial [Fructobacillus ficulneus]|uniref:histidinol dehydrogenase n=1 Tax=Fructobacillus ficulneus TaxID=157463 RepID=UPI000A563055